MTGQPGVMASREVPLRSRRSERTVQPHESHLRSVPPCPWRWKGDTSWVDRSPSRANRREAVASVVFVRSCGGGSAVEDALPVLGERAEPDILGGLAVLLGGVLAAASPGGADAGDPAGGPIDATGEAWGFDEGLDEDGVGAVAAGPVAGQVAADECEDVGSEVGDADPGQDEESGVVDDQRQVLPTQGGDPSDEAVARCDRRGSGQRTELGGGGITRMTRPSASTTITGPHTTWAYRFRCRPITGQKTGSRWS